MYDENNIFAKIIRGDLPCVKVYEDENFLFINDIKPATKIHVLGIPKMPYFDFYDFVSNNSSEKIADFYKKTNMVIKKIGIKDSGFRIITNSGVDGNQEVPHFHIHILGGEKVGPL